MIKGWTYGRASTDWIKQCEKNYGCVYAAKVPVLQGFSLLKIGATSSPKSRLSNCVGKASIFAISPSHLNFWENEMILHEYFKRFRVPCRPHKGVQAEFFNISISYFIKMMPELVYAQSFDDVNSVFVENYSQPINYIKK